MNVMAVERCSTTPLPPSFNQWFGDSFSRIHLATFWLASVPGRFLKGKKYGLVSIALVIVHMPLQNLGNPRSLYVYTV